MLGAKSWNNDREKSNDDVKEDNYVYAFNQNTLHPTSSVTECEYEYDSLRLMSFPPHLIWLCVASGVIAG
jgi:hypothetical protein